MKEVEAKRLRKLRMEGRYPYFLELTEAIKAMERVPKKQKKQTRKCGDELMTQKEADEMFAAEIRENRTIIGRRIW